MKAPDGPAPPLREAEDEGVTTGSKPRADETCPPTVLMHEVQLILAEKRTSLSGLRTGIAVFAIPLSVMGLLVATSSHYRVDDIRGLFVAVMAINALLIALGGYLVVRAVLKLRREDRLIAEIKRRHSVIAEFLD